MADGFKESRDKSPSRLGFRESGGEPPSRVRRKILAAFMATVFFLTGLQTVAYTQEPAARRGRRVSNASAAEATVTINEQFLNSFLEAMFDNLREPSMPLNVGGGPSSSNSEGGCASEIRLKREMNGVRTAVHFDNGRITGPLAFAGAYNSTLMGCIQFSGWADSEVNLGFDANRQALVARFHLSDIHLSDVPSLANGPVLNMVQSTIDRKYNPVELLTLEQLSTRVNVQPAGGALRLHATDVRPEITPSGLALHITYEFVKG
jgi:hypothetical protein